MSPESDQPAGQVPLDWTELQGTRRVPPPVARTVHMRVVGRGVVGRRVEEQGTRRVQTRGAVGRGMGAHVTASVAVAGLRTFQPGRHVLTRTVLPRQPPTTCTQLIGHRMATRRVQVIPVNLVELVTTSQFLGHAVTPICDKQPPATRVQRKGQVSVCFMRVQLTPCVAVAGAITLKREGHFRTPRRARQPPGMVVMDAGQL